MTKLKPINGDYVCDRDTMIRQNRPWFRFASDAGNRLLDTCPRSLSCGAVAGAWSDDDMPTTIGVNATINVYGHCLRLNPTHSLPL